MGSSSNSGSNSEEEEEEYSTDEESHTPPTPTVLAKRSSPHAHAIPIASTDAVVATPIANDRFAGWYANNCNDHVHEVEAIALTTPTSWHLGSEMSVSEAIDDLIDRQSQMANWEELISAHTVEQVPTV
jgi:hypothetical protein